jgi:hypothetical protein
MVVRFEVDACRSSSTVPKKPTDKTTNVDELATLLSATSLSSKSRTLPTKKDPSGLTVIHAGTLAPQSSILELSTRSTRNAAEFDWPEALPQLLLSRTPAHILGVHERGQFFELRNRALGSPELRDAERLAQTGMKKLRVVLESLQDFMLEEAIGKNVSLVCKDGVLKVFEREGEAGLLPDEDVKRFFS